jgi:hypothetical protein
MGEQAPQFAGERDGGRRYCVGIVDLLSTFSSLPHGTPSSAAGAMSVNASRRANCAGEEVPTADPNDVIWEECSR